jgi:hypothetical protein
MGQFLCAGNSKLLQLTKFSLTFHTHLQDAQTKWPIKKQPMRKKAQAQNQTTHAQNGPSSKLAKLKTAHGTERPTAQNGPRHITTHSSQHEFLDV